MVISKNLEFLCSYPPILHYCVQHNPRALVSHFLNAGEQFRRKILRHDVNVNP